MKEDHLILNLSFVKLFEDFNEAFRQQICHEIQDY